MANRKAGKNKPVIVAQPRAVNAGTAETAVAAVEVAKAAQSAQPEVSIEAPAEPVAAPQNVASSVEVQTETVESGANSMTETITNTVNQAQEATQQAAQQATQQFRGAFNDANERGKAALEKGARFAEEMADLTRGNLEAFVASQKTAAKYAETLAQGAADYGRRSFEEASSALRSFAEAKSPTDIFRLQSDFARSAFDSMVAESARVSETVVKMSGEVAEPITSRYAVAAERLKTVAA